VATPQTDRCHLGFTVVRPPVSCVYGDPAGTRTVVLFGDSHALQWFPALDRLAHERRWKLVSLTKSSCPPARIDVTNNTLKRAYSECATWQAESLARIRALHPALVLVTSSINYRNALVTPAGADGKWRLAWDTLFGELTRAASRVTYLVDTPTLPLDVLGCLAEHPASIDRCAAPTSAGLREPEWRAVVSQVALLRGVSVVDPNPWICGDVCPAVLGDTIVYRDANHLTAPMATALAPLLGARLP
jgi:hypothetical protein